MLGQILDNKIQKEQKNPTATSEEPAVKKGWEQKQGAEHAPCAQHRQSGGQNT